ncbi:MAG: aminotransferase class V-fold PLP-dependent enzyme [bacterium]
MNSEKTFLDQAATSYPKPTAVYEEVDRFARQTGIGGGRGNYAETRKVADIFEQTRELIAGLIGAAGREIVFTSGTTESLNALLRGLLNEGDHVIISPFEHNSVLRPLNYLQEEKNIKITRVEATVEAGIDPGQVAEELRPRTRLCLINQITNASGLIQPVEQIGELLAEREDIFFLVDAAQSVGTHPIDVQSSSIDALAFSGHKGLLAPTGTGGFYINERMVGEVVPLKLGGTGRNGGTKKFSDELPYKFEVGTQNSWGIAGLRAGLQYIHERGIEKVEAHIDDLTLLARDSLQNIASITTYFPQKQLHHGVFAFNADYLPPHDLAELLDSLFNIKVRAGLQCSPGFHKINGTYPDGTVRASLGLMNTAEDVKILTAALEKMEAEHGAR